MDLLEDKISHPWTLNRILTVFLSLTFLGLSFDLRSEHIDVVETHWTAWIPIYFSLAAFLIGLLTTASWTEPSRRLFFWWCLAGMGIGLLGFWFHNEPHLMRNVLQVFQAWYLPLPHREDAPVLAPLAISGLSFLGMLTTSKKYQP
jgi:hypothetical protein